MAQLTWNGTRLTWDARAAVADGLDKAAALLAREVRRSLGTPYPPASRPGQPPHRRTGRLQRGVRHKTNRKTLVSMVFHDPSVAYYGMPLEKGTRDGRLKARPHLAPMVRKLSKRMTAIVATAVRRAFRIDTSQRRARARGR